MGLPAGFTNAGTDRSQVGVFFYQGKHVEGTYVNGGKTLLILAGGEYSQVDAQPLLDFENSPEFAAMQSGATYQAGVAQSVGTPMNAVLTDPEWMALQGKQVQWSSLSAGLQAKIAKVPALYAQLTGDQAAYDKLAAEQKVKDDAAAAAFTANADANARYRVNGNDVTGADAQALNAAIKTGDQSAIAQTIATVAPVKTQISPRIPVAPTPVPVSVDPVLKIADGPDTTGTDALNALRRVDNSGTQPQVGPSDAAPVPASGMSVIKPGATATSADWSHWVGIGLLIVLVLMLVFHFAR